MLVFVVHAFRASVMFPTVASLRDVANRTEWLQDVTQHINGEAGPLHDIALVPEPDEDTLFAATFVTHTHHMLTVNFRDGPAFNNAPELPILLPPLYMLSPVEDE